MYNLVLLPLVFAAASAGIIAAPVHHQPHYAVETRPGTFSTSHSSVYRYGVITPVAVPVHGHHAPAPAPVHLVHAAPAPVVHAAPAPVVHAAPAPVVHAAPAHVVLAAPTPVVHAAPAPVVHAAPAPHTAIVTRPGTFSTSHSKVYQYGVITPVAIPVAHHAPAPAPAPLLLTHATH